MNRPLIESVVIVECPACGRTLQASVELLGKPVACQHCEKRFIARERHALELSPAALDERVERLLSLETERPPRRMATRQREPHQIDRIA